MLLTKAIKASLPKLYSQENEADPMVYLKFFNPCGAWTAYITEGEPATPDNNGDYENNDFLFFGWVTSPEPELGYLSLNELSSVKLRWGLGIERDLHFTPCRLSECKAKGR